jgi:hypothetical protein
MSGAKSGDANTVSRTRCSGALKARVMHRIVIASGDGDPAIPTIAKK